MFALFGRHFSPLFATFRHFLVVIKCSVLRSVTTWKGVDYVIGRYSHVGFTQIIQFATNCFHQYFHMKNNGQADVESHLDVLSLVPSQLYWEPLLAKNYVDCMLEQLDSIFTETSPLMIWICEREFPLQNVIKQIIRWHWQPFWNMQLWLCRVELKIHFSNHDVCPVLILSPDNLTQATGKDHGAMAFKFALSAYAVAWTSPQW